MTPERWQQVKDVLDRTIALAVPDRSPFLDRICAADLELRREVESLLQSHSQANSLFLNTPALDLLNEAPAHQHRNEPVGRRIGVYQVVEEIGHGGMGEVYRAIRADGQYEKQVAIKLVPGGYSAFIQERFLQERQILALLDHPNIAHLLDGGTTEDGIPYLVMELIEGMPIDQYCDAHGLHISERLELFRVVCAAVQFAHQRLVIHRDIKPTNILVTEEGVAKLLDFGIAKILDPSVGSELTLARPMTPEYASPEQVSGEPITTSTDVYSLGVVLYHLMTGHSPYLVDTRAPVELARAISDVDPERPSIAVLRRKEKRDDGEIGALLPEAIGRTREGSAAKLRRRLAGDLDNIALKALRKQPQRRYGSVEQLAEDIRRHLEGLPVTARKDSWSYRAGKFIRRHKVGVAATALLALAVLGGLAAILHEARIAEANRRQAEKRFSDVRKLANSLMFEIHDSIRELPGSTPARKLLVSRALEYLDSLNQQAKGDASLQKELAAAYERMGDVLGYPYYANLGDTPGALQSFQKAAVIRESLVAARPDDAQLQMELAATYFRIANVLESTGDFGAALQMVHKALPITQRIASGSNDPALADQLAGGYYYTAGLLGQTGDPVGALENYRKAASVREAALQANHQSVPLRTHLAADYGGIALSMRDQGDLVQAIQMQAKAVGILEELARARPDNTTRREFWAEAVNRFATFRKDHGEAVAALQAFRQAHQIFGELLSADPKNSLARVNYGFSGNGIAESLIALGKPAAALRILREEVVTFEEMSPGAANNRYVRTGLAMSYSGLGRAHSALASEPHLSAGEMQKRWGEARSWYEKGLAVWIDKEKRGELESDERKEPQIVTQEIARCEMEIAKTESPGKR